MRDKTVAVWVSCGAASAAAAHVTIQQYGEHNTIRLIYNPVREEHSDNLRFLHDVERWCGIKIEVAINPAYPLASAEDVWRRRKYMGGTAGAPCTVELKKRARQHWENNNTVDYHVLGFTLDERDRHERFVLTERDNVLPVLIDAKMNKQACLDYVMLQGGIKPPEAYALGLPNANCLGCVKATSPTYWNLIRKIAPDVFERRSSMSRELGARLVRVDGERVFLDELDPSASGRPLKTMQIDCGLFCEEPLK